MAAKPRLYLAATLIVAGGAVLHRTMFRDAPESALLASLLAGGIATAFMTMVGHDPF